MRGPRRALFLAVLKKRKTSSDKEEKESSRQKKDARAISFIGKKKRQRPRPQHSLEFRRQACGRHSVEEAGGVSRGKRGRQLRKSGKARFDLALRRSRFLNSYRAGKGDAAPREKGKKIGRRQMEERGRVNELAV